jgi:hypothetical protein
MELSTCINPEKLTPDVLLAAAVGCRDTAAASIAIQRGVGEGEHVRALVLACASGQADMVDVLIRSLQGRPDNTTAMLPPRARHAMWAACRYGDERIIKLLHVAGWLTNIEHDIFIRHHHQHLNHIFISGPNRLQ